MIGVQNGVRIWTGTNGTELRFTIIEPGSLTPFSPEFWNWGPIPHDDATRATLTRLGFG